MGGAVAPVSSLANSSPSPKIHNIHVFCKCCVSNVKDTSYNGVNMFVGNYVNTV